MPKPTPQQGYNGMATVDDLAAAWGTSDQKTPPGPSPEQELAARLRDARVAGMSSGELVGYEQAVRSRLGMQPAPAADAAPGAGMMTADQAAAMARTGTTPLEFQPYGSPDPRTVARDTAASAAAAHVQGMASDDSPNIVTRNVFNLAGQVGSGLTGALVDTAKSIWWGVNVAASATDKYFLTPVGAGSFPKGQGVTDIANAQYQATPNYASDWAAAMGFAREPDEKADPARAMRVEQIRQSMASDPVGHDMLQTSRRIQAWGAEHPAQQFIEQAAAFLATAFVTKRITGFSPLLGEKAAETVGEIEKIRNAGRLGRLATAGAGFAAGMADMYLMTPGTARERLESTSMAFGITPEGTPQPVRWLAALPVLLGVAGALAFRGPAGSPRAFRERLPADMLDDPRAARVTAAIERGTVDPRPVEEVWAKTKDLDAVHRVAQAMALENGDNPARWGGPGDVQSDPFIPGGSDRPAEGAAPQPEGVVPKIRGRVAYETELADMKYQDEGISGGDRNRMAKRLVRSGDEDSAAWILSFEPGTEEFRAGLDAYHAVVGDEVASKWVDWARKAQQVFPGVTGTDLNVMVDKLFAMEYGARTRGIAMNTSVNLLDRIVADVDANLRASHPEETGDQAELAGRVSIEDSARLARPSAVAVKGARPTTSTYMVRAANIAIDLLADNRPGRLAKVLTHELAHVYLHYLHDVDPAKYGRLADEVRGIVGRFIDPAQIGNLDDPRFLAEHFTKMLEHYSVLDQESKLIAADGSIERVKWLDHVGQKFGGFVGKLIDDVQKWRQQYLRGGGMFGSNDAANLPARQVEWSGELRQTARAFSEGDWSHVFDDRAADRRAPGERRATFFETRAAEDDEPPAGRMAVRLVAGDNEPRAGQVVPFPVRDVGHAGRILTTADRVGAYAGMYDRAPRTGTVFDKQGRLALVSGTGRAHFLAEMAKNGHLPNELPGSLVEGDRATLAESARAADDARPLSLADPSKIDRVVRNPKMVAELNKQEVITDAPGTDASHAIASGLAQRFLAAARKAGVTTKTVLHTEGYAPVTPEQWAALAQYKDQVEVAFSIPPDLDPAQAKMREAQFRMAKRAGVPVRRELVDPVLGQHLLAGERAKLSKRNVVSSFMRLLSRLPGAEEMANVAFAGRAKRGWYRGSAQAISDVFGPDAPRFAQLLAATSPQTSVENNLLNALNIWKNWDAAGRPTDPKAILRIMGDSVQGNKGEESVMDAWYHNTVRALTAEDPAKTTISGPKVNSFFRNLIGHTHEVTNDAWMANYAFVDQKMFAGKLLGPGDPGKRPGYLAMFARVREAAAYLTKYTGEEWTPAEVQETIWSWAKTLYELSDAKGETRSAVELLRDKAVTDALVNATPDFRTLFHSPEYDAILRQAGYGDRLDALQSSGDNGVTRTRRKAPPTAGKAGRRLLEGAAQRLDALREQRAAESAAAAEAPGTEFIAVDGVSRRVRLAPDVSDAAKKTLNKLDFSPVVDALLQHPDPESLAAAAERHGIARNDPRALQVMTGDPDAWARIEALAGGDPEQWAVLRRNADDPAFEGGRYPEVDGQRYVPTPGEEAAHTDVFGQIADQVNATKNTDYWNASRVRGAVQEIVADPPKPFDGQAAQTYFERTTAADRQEMAAQLLRAAAQRARDPERAAQLARSADKADALAQVMKEAPRDTDPVEGIAAAAATGGGSAKLGRGLIDVARFGYRNAFKNLFEPVARVSKDISNRFSVTLSADGEGKLMAARAWQKLMRAQPSPEEIDLFERWGQTEKAKVALARGGELGEGMKSLMLTPGEQDQVATNPKIQQMIKTYREEVQPELEMALIQIDPENAKHLLETDSGIFFPSMRYDERLMGENVRRSGGGTKKSVPAMYDVAKNSGSMKRFSGGGESYVTDIRELLRMRFTRDLTLMRQKQLVQALIDQGLAHPATPAIEDGIKVPTRSPDPIVIDGHEVGWRRIRTADRPTWVTQYDDATGATTKLPMAHEEYWVPDPIAKSWQYTMEKGWRDLQFGKGPSGNKNIWYQMADFTTAAMLATSAEAARHQLRVLAMLARIPAPTTMVVDSLAKILLPYFGPRMKGLFDIANVYHSPEAEHLEWLLTRAGGNTDRALSEARVSGETLGRAAGWVAGKVGASEERAGAIAQGVGQKTADLVHKGSRYLFEKPDPDASTNLLSKQGWRVGPMGLPVPAALWGFDVRARILATKIFVEHLRATGQLDPSISVETLARMPSWEFDSALREYLTQFGMFNAKLQTTLVQKVKALRLDPFAGAEAGFRPAELETLVGIHRLPMAKDAPVWLRAWYSGQVLAGGVLGYYGALMLINKAVSGKWPWQNQDGHQFDLELPWKEKDGTPAYVDVGFLEPAAGRALRTTGLKFALDERYGTSVPERIARAGSQKAIQEGLGFMAAGPPAQFLTTLVAGRAPYISGKDQSLLRTAPPAGTMRGQLWNNTLAALTQLNSYGGALFSDNLATGREFANPSLKYTFGAAEMLVGKVGSPGVPSDVAAGALSRLRTGQRKDLAQFYVGKYLEAGDEAKQREVYGTYLAQFRTPLARQLAIKEFWNAYGSRGKGAAKGAVMSDLLRQDEAR